MTITNYYLELCPKKGTKGVFSSESTIEEIKQALVELDRVWNQRVHTQPEESQKKLVLLSEAKKIFIDEDSKKKYDIELENSTKGPEVIDFNEEKRAKFEEWKEKASDYYDNKKYDLAITALNKVFEYRFDEHEVDSLILAGLVYNDAHQYQKALEYINQALILKPEHPISYRVKFIAMYNLVFTNEEKMDKTTRFSKGNELDTLLEDYIQKIELKGRQEDIETAKSYAAGQLYFLLSGFELQEGYNSDNLIESSFAKKGLNIANEVPNSINGQAIINMDSKVREYIKSKRELEGKNQLSWELLLNKFVIIGGIIAILLLKSLGVFLVLLAVFGVGYYIYNSNNTYKLLLEKKNKLWAEIIELYEEWKKDNF